MEYVNRISALEKDKTYSLSAQGIASGDHLIKYDSIKSIHLKYVPSRYYSKTYTCKIIHSNGELVLSNRRFIKLATFEYQCDSYNAFVIELHQKLSSRTQLTSGMNQTRYWLELPISIAFFTLVLGVIFTFGHPLLAIVFLFIITIRLIPYYRKNYPRRYLIESIPKNILPKP